MMNPFLQREIDFNDWIQHLVSIHFHPEYGTAYWIARAKELKINPEQDIRTYEDLDLLGYFDVNVLRKQDVRHFIPAASRKNLGALQIYETGGTTGTPARFAVKTFWNQQIEWMNWYFDNVLKFPRDVHWVWIGPTGPHAVGHTIKDIINLRGGMCYYIDLDPRFIKLLHAKNDHDTIQLYMDHIQRQAYDILETQQIDVLATTPVILESMASELVQRNYSFKGLFYGGTHVSPDTYHLLKTKFFPDAVDAAEYGNSLTGKAPIRPYQPSQREVVYYSCYPYSILTVVDPDNPSRIVEYGETGRIQVSTLTEDLFIPRLLERDGAERWTPIPELGWDGVANVRPFTTKTNPTVIEGVY